MYATQLNNYGSSITAKPYGGPIARSLTSSSASPMTGNSTRDAMTRALADQNRNTSEASRESFENQFNTEFQRARANDVMAQRNNELQRYRLSQKKTVDDAARSMSERQNMRTLASRLASQKVSDKWNAINDYTTTFLRPAFLSPEYGVLQHGFRETTGALVPDATISPLATDYGGYPLSRYSNPSIASNLIG